MTNIAQIDWNKLTAAEFYNWFSTEEAAFNIADQLELLHSEVLCECGLMMKRQSCVKSKHGQQFACTNLRRICRKTRSILACSWFASSHITICQGFYTILAFSMEATCSQYSFFVGLRSLHTIVDYRSYFRNICASTIESTGSHLIGGPGLTVEVDESLLYKRKSHTGRLLANERNHEWVVGGICRENSDAFVVKVENRNTATLLNAINQNVISGSRIITDCWRAYTSELLDNYTHDRVNHSFNFVDPNDSSINTQRVERMWRTLKSIVSKSSSEETRFTYISEFIFKQRNNWYSLTIGSRIKLIIDTIKRINLF